MSNAAAAATTSKALMIGLGALAALALLYVFVISPLLAPDEIEPLTVDLPDSAAAAVQADAAAAEIALEDEESDEVEEAPLPETFEVFSARDPFQQLVITPAAAGEPSAPGSPAAPVATPVGTTPGGGSVDPADPAPPAEPVTGTPATRVGTTVVRLVDISTAGDASTASITVNGTGYQVAEGETFAESFRVLDLSGTCATLLFGDSRFTLCAGDEIRK